MADEYSIYDAKTHLSAIVRQVREGRSAVITVHGEPVAEIRPYVAAPATLEARLAAMTERGTLHPAEHRAPIRPGARKTGVLRRFLASRD